LNTPVIRWGMNWTEIVSAFVAGVLLAIISILKKKSSDKKQKWGYNPRCVDCPLFQEALTKIRKVQNDEKDEEKE
jgi:hypothetical protein